MGFIETAILLGHDQDIHKLKSFAQRQAVARGAVDTDLLDVFIVKDGERISAHPRYVLMVDVKNGPKIIDLAGE